MSKDDENLLEESWEGQLIEYSLGVMSPVESLEFERHMNECRAHIKLSEKYSHVVGWVGASVLPAEPPSGHKARMMARIAATSQDRVVALPNAASTSVAAPIPSTIAALPPSTLAPPLEPTVLPVSEEAERSPAQVTSLDEYRKNRHIARNLALLSSVAAAVILLVAGGWLFSLLSKPYIPSGYTAVLLQPQTSSAKGSAVAFVNLDKNEVVLLGSDLEQLPAQKVYELWVIPAKGQPQAAGTFVPQQGGTARHEVRTGSNIRDYGTIAITVEDAPGTQAPTMPPIFAGKTTQ